MARARGWAGVGGLIMLVGVLSACAEPTDPGDAPVPHPVATNAGFGDAPAPSTVTEAHFVSPSRNIGCYVDKSGARCDIIQRSWQPPEEPDDCDLDWGGGISVDKKGSPTFTCAGDTVIGGKETLAYGTAVRAGDFVCSSDSTAMRCENVESGHGFSLAKDAYELF